jgi:hypothetical protein
MTWWILLELCARLQMLSRKWCEFKKKCFQIMMFCNAIFLLMQGARRVYAFASHGVFSGPASGRIAKSALTELVVLDTIPLHPEAMVSFY